MATLLVLAWLLGVLYNQASPLGLRPTASPAAAPTSAPRLYSNQTVAFSLELTPSAPAAPLAGAPATPAPATALPYLPALDPAFLAMAKTNLPSLRWAQVKPLLQAKKIILLDARQKERYNISHIPGALSLPVMSTLEELMAFAQAHPKDTPLVTYCASDQCHTSAQLAEALIKVCGFTNVSDMPGGYAEYLIVEDQTKPAP
ncbi:MAG: rhodanese-like domain-containing protein [Verrucomicrobiota bacterium]